MRKSKIIYLFFVLIEICFMVVSSNKLAQAGPPLKEGNPGVPGLLAKIAQLEQTVAHQKAIIQELLNAMQNYAPVPKTGQAISYLPGDDGDLQMGLFWPDPRFTDHGDGTITDNLTGLMWTTNPGPQRAWAEALAWCNNLAFAGHDDWRLPNVRELQSLMDYGRYDPALPEGHPFTQLSDYYWTSTMYRPDQGWIFFINIYQGTIGYIGWQQAFGVSGWCARGGR